MTDEPTDVSPFDQIRQETPEGGEYWSARELAVLLGYTNWRNFALAVERAQMACAQSGRRVPDHFDASIKMVVLGSGAQRQVKDYNLSRYACYLVVQNADPSKEIVALGQTYFAVQTNRAEQMDAVAGLTEAQRRLHLRGQVAVHNRHLAATAMHAGVITSQDFAVFQNHGYRGLYGGEAVGDIAARKGLKPGQAILDHMNAEELAANYFRVTQTEAKIRREGITGKAAANQAHQEVGEEIRATIGRLGSTMPEDQPTPTKSIKQLEREEEERRRLGAQLPLFPDEESQSDD